VVLTGWSFGGPIGAIIGLTGGLFEFCNNFSKIAHTFLVRDNRKIDEEEQLIEQHQDNN
jgi:hypothetical protein